MNTTIDQRLRPLTLGEILDRMVQVYRHNFLVFAGVAAMPIGVMFGIGALAGSIGTVLVRTSRGTVPSGFFAGITVVIALVVAVPLYLAAYVYSTAALTRAAADVCQGAKPTIRAALASVRPFFSRYLGFLILQGLIVGGVPLAAAGGVVAVVFFAARLAGGGLLAGVAGGFAAFLLFGGALVVIVWLALGYSLGMPICVMEQKPAWESLTRAWGLSQGTRGRILATFLLIFVLSIVVSMIAYIPFLAILAISALFGNDAQHASMTLVVAEIVNVIANFTLQTLIAPLTWIALVLFYYDQRVRKEGYDIEWMMEQAGLIAAQAAPGTSPISTVASAAASDTPAIEQAQTDFRPTLPSDSVEER